MVNVLFICMGNICRSPTAEGAFLKLVRQEGFDSLIRIDSAGTHAYHVGEPPDRRAQAAALARGIDLSAQRARRVESADYELFDLLIPMDEDNQRFLLEECPHAGHRSKVRLFMEFAPEIDSPVVPDPYYGGARGFERVLDLVEKASEGLLHEIRETYALRSDRGKDLP
jgi:protein-tyrosine phosphatase